MTALRDPLAPKSPSPPNLPARQHPRRFGAGGRPARAQPARPLGSGDGALVQTVATSLIALGIVVGWFVFYALLVSGLQTAHSQSVLYSQLREQLANATAPVGGKITPDAPVALLDMPSAGLHHEVVVEGTASGDLMRGPGHKRDTPLPGQAGTSVIYGRATLFGGPFGSLTSVRAGDQINVTTAEGAAKYLVQDVRHVGDPYPAALGSGEGRLTLITAEGNGWREGWAPSRAVYVDAGLASKPFPTPPGGISGVPTSETAMRGDPSALFVLVLWLPVLAVAVGATLWAYARWGKWQSWVVGGPVVLAALWGVSQTAVQLLPNLM